MNFQIEIEKLEHSLLLTKSYNKNSILNCKYNNELTNYKILKMMRKVDEVKE